MKEKTLEKNLRKGVEERGGQAIKLLSVIYSGLPDRLILMPGQFACVAETKTTGKKQSPRQVTVMGMFVDLGFDYFVIDTQEALDDFFKFLDNR